MDAVEYFKEKARMAQSCRIDCKSCGLSNYKNGTNLGCKHFELEFYAKIPQNVVNLNLAEIAAKNTGSHRWRDSHASII